MSAAHRTSSATRRSLLTATAAGTLLGALWFVPSANATMEKSIGPTTTVTTRSGADTSGASGMTTMSGGASLADTSSVSGTPEGGAADGRELADTGSFNTTPYVFGGLLFLGLGAGFVTYSVRRERTDLY